jgi:hypothetical protein
MPPFAGHLPFEASVVVIRSPQLCSLGRTTEPFGPTWAGFHRPDWPGETGSL